MKNLIIDLRVLALEFECRYGWKIRRSFARATRAIGGIH